MIKRKSRLLHHSGKVLQKMCMTSNVNCWVSTTDMYMRSHMTRKQPGVLEVKDPQRQINKEKLKAQ